MTVNTQKLRELLKQGEEGWPFGVSEKLAWAVPALLDEIDTHRTFLSALQDELNLILTDDETELSPGALRTLLWANEQIDRALS